MVRYARNYHSRKSCHARILPPRPPQVKPIPYGVPGTPHGAIAAILRRNGLPASPERKGLTWRDFLARHAAVTLCADFFTKEIWTFCGLKTAYVFFVMHMETRRILLAEATFSPHSRWMGQMARNVMMQCDDLGVQPRIMLHDRDALFPNGLDPAFEHARLKIIKTPFHAPNANAYAERWVRSARNECLNHLVLCGINSLQRTIHAYRDFFNAHRPHQGIGNSIPNNRAARAERPDTATDPSKKAASEVECTHFLGGLLKSYFRRAA